ncbi:carbohydrate-binding module family 5 protein [Trametes coccinea BRFM310]|uniref:chitinase n=1 Tax=Trametes coccinea (strain BRFM310) TaxID=1353009 RepID=A0A1Y2I964_TRAC3|nr:carbohydrate-binding module family 5 protein [Trametes coccinea BRFM310]
MSPFRLAAALSALCLAALPAIAFDNSRSDNLAVYWGQNSYGATHLSDTANWQKSIDYYCQDDAIDAIPIAFLNVFQSTGGFPSINLASTCNTDDNGVFPGTSLPNCTFLASAIEYCQSRGKIVTISLGGATGAASFTSAAQATAFGDTIWDLFLGGDSQLRPFGGAVLDGIDLDIEGGNTVYFDSFIARIRELASIAGGKRYYVTAAPQCPYPDGYLGTVLNLASFDAVYVQFYNNWCGLQNYNNIWAWDFSSWDTWAKTVSVNPDVKIYIGAPASSTAAGSGYVDATTLGNIAIQQRGNYSSFGGVMLWDASQAYANNRYDLQVKNIIKIGTGGSTTSSPLTVPTIGISTTTTRTSTTTRASTTGTSTRTGSTTRTSATGTSTPSCTCTCSSGTSTRSSTRTSATGTSSRTSVSGTSSTRSSATGTSTRSSTRTSATGTSAHTSTRTGTSTRTSGTSTGTSTRTSASSTRTSSTATSTSRSSSRSSSSTRASSTSTRGTTTSTRASTTTKATTTSTRASSTTTRTSTTSSSSAPTSTGSTCTASPWSSGTTYVGGNQVSYNGHLWTAKWWSYNDVPGGPAGVWTDNGPC